MISYNAKLRLCALCGGLIRVDMVVPDSEDLSGNLGLCGNGNGDTGDDPDEGSDIVIPNDLRVLVNRLSPIHSGDGNKKGQKPCRRPRSKC